MVSFLVEKLMTADPFLQWFLCRHEPFSTGILFSSIDVSRHTFFLLIFHAADNRREGIPTVGKISDSKRIQALEERSRRAIWRLDSFLRVERDLRPTVEPRASEGKRTKEKQLPRIHPSISLLEGKDGFLLLFFSFLKLLALSFPWTSSSCRWLLLYYSSLGSHGSILVVRERALSKRFFNELISWGPWLFFLDLWPSEEILLVKKLMVFERDAFLQLFSAEPWGTKRKLENVALQK